MRKSRSLVALIGLMIGTLILVSCLTVDAKATVDLSILEGFWEGTYEYLDYQGDATRVQVPSTLIVTVKRSDLVTGTAEASLVFLYSESNGVTRTEERLMRYFPTESLIEYGGNWAITEAATDPQTAYLRLVFTGTGVDDDREALVRQTIERLGDALMLREEVRYKNVSDYITRDEFQLRRTN